MFEPQRRLQRAALGCHQTLKPRWAGELTRASLRRGGPLRPRFIANSGRIFLHKSPATKLRELPGRGVSSRRSPGERDRPKPMLFNSSIFFAFYAAFFPLYWLVHRNRRARTLLILVGSYVFYGAWDWRFLSLIIASTIVDFFCGGAIAASPNPKTQPPRTAWA